jgi:hypothetical protein
MCTLKLVPLQESACFIPEHLMNGNAIVCGFGLILYEISTLNVAGHVHSGSFQNVKGFCFAQWRGLHIRLLLKSGRAIAQTDTGFHLETQVQFRVTSSEIRGGRSGTETGFFCVFLFSSSNHFTIAPYSSITAPRGVR